MTRCSGAIPAPYPVRRAINVVALWEGDIDREDKDVGGGGVGGLDHPEDRKNSRMDSERAAVPLIPVSDKAAHGAKRVV